VGIRVNKVLGYGFDDVGIRDSTIDDPRLAVKSIWGIEEAQDGKVRDFVEYIEHSMEPDDIDALLIVSGLKDKLDYSLLDCFCHNTEYADDRVFLVVPPSHLKYWWRRDDIIDYTEELLNCDQDGPDIRIQPVRSGIYPYNGVYINTTTKESVHHEIVRAVIRWEKMPEDSKSGHKAAVDYFLEHAGYGSVDAFWDMVCPIIPHEIIYLQKYLKFLADDEDLYKMRPYLYTFWS